MLETLLIAGVLALVGSGTYLGFRLGKRSATAHALPALPAPQADEEPPALPPAGAYRTPSDRALAVPEKQSWLQRRQQRREIAKYHAKQVERYRQISDISSPAIDERAQSIANSMDIQYLLNRKDLVAAALICKRNIDADREAFLAILYDPRMFLEGWQAYSDDWRLAVSGRLIDYAESREMFDEEMVRAIIGLPHCCRELSWKHYLSQAVKHHPNALKWAGLE